MLSWCESSYLFLPVRGSTSTDCDGEDCEVKNGGVQLDHYKQNNVLGGHITDEEKSECGMESPCTPPTNTVHVFEETPVVNWSDGDWNTSPVINSTHSLPNQGKMKLHHSSSSTSEDTVPKLKPESTDWDNSWQDESTSLSNENPGSGPQSGELGLEYDIKNITVKKVTSPELDFFADMAPQIVATEATSILSVLPENDSKAGSSLTFAVEESEVICFLSL